MSSAVSVSRWDYSPALGQGDVYLESRGMQELCLHRGWCLGGQELLGAVSCWPCLVLRPCRARGSVCAAFSLPGHTGIQQERCVMGSPQTPGVVFLPELLHHTPH